MRTNRFNSPQLIVVTTSYQADVAVVHIAGEVDMSSVEPLETAVWREFAASPSALVLDMQDVEFCGSSALRVLIQARERAASSRIGLRVVATSPAVLRVLDISGLTDLFEVRDSVRQAVEEVAD